MRRSRVGSRLLWVSLGAVLVAGAVLLIVLSLPGQLNAFRTPSQIVAADLGVLSEHVLRKLMRIKGVANIRSNIVLGCIKSTTELPLGHIGRNDGQARKVRMSG